MKQVINKCFWAMAIALFVTPFYSCEEEGQKESTDDQRVNAAVTACAELETMFASVPEFFESNQDEQFQKILTNYVEQTIYPTYKNLAEAALGMRTANEALKQEPTDERMQAASDAWMKARIAWELSEGFLFGPVDDSNLDIDAHVDSWPLELNDIKEVLTNEATGLDGRTAWKMEPEVIGFHVTEYLLYRDGKSRKAADLSAAELKYLTSATDALVWDCVLAYVAWIGEENVSDEMKSVFKENPDVVAHLTANPQAQNYGEKLMNKMGYPSWADALSEISDGAAEIAGEVGATKIAAPFQTGKVEDVESWYSWHSLDDYQNNIKSIKNAYLGGDSKLTLSAYVAKVNPDLDKKIKAKIDDTIAKIKAIGEDGRSFYEVVRDNR